MTPAPCSGVSHANNEIVCGCGDLFCHGQMEHALPCASQRAVCGGGGGGAVCGPTCENYYSSKVFTQY